MPPQEHAKPIPKVQNRRKTKSRNGCGRCKIKRLKCDETSPACVQCSKRNVACPGYEKTLKWVRKYEVFTPVQFGDGNAGSSVLNEGKLGVGEDSLAPGVVDGFEAMAAVVTASSRDPTVPESDTEADIDGVDTDFAVTTDSSTRDALAMKFTTPQEEQVLASRSHTLDYLTLNILLTQEETTFTDRTDAPDLPLFEDFEEPQVDFDQEFGIGFDGDIGLPVPGILDDLGFDIEEIPRLPEETTKPIPLTGATHSGSVSDSLDSLGLNIEEISRPPEENTDPNTTGTITAHLSSLHRSLLLDYYRIPHPSFSSLGDIESLLVQQYFKDICVLFSSFDSFLNPFRTAIGRIFQGSQSVYYAIQSMAAAHLANTYPDMAEVGLQMQRKACDSLQSELLLVQSGQKNATASFLAIILIGMTTTWHESSALGEEFLATARSLILPKLLCSPEREEVKRDTQFFEEALIYWEMLIGFVTEDSATLSLGKPFLNRGSQKPAPMAKDRLGMNLPHPWTGIAPTVQVLFAEVGRLVRRERLLHMSILPDYQQIQDNILNASTLEEDLLAAEYPLAEELVDPGDERTPTRDFIVMAEVYRCTGLLELYRVFPLLLRKRLGTDPFIWNKFRIDMDIPPPTPRFGTPYEDTDTRLWINSLALYILDALASLPSFSGTRCLQPILLVAVGSELQFVSSVDHLDVYANNTRVRQAREFVDQRLNEYALRLPAKPLRKSIELVREVWRRMDGGEETFWIDVMVENGWHTLLG